MPDCVINKICYCNKRTIGHLAGNNKIFFCKYLREVFPFLYKEIFYNDFEVIKDKLIVGGI